jgi:hypothetical protein
MKNLLKNCVKKRYEYFKEYREKFGDIMRLQIREWFREHPDYLKEWGEQHPNYFKYWRMKHPDYFKKWREEHKEQWNEYLKNYMKMYRVKSQPRKYKKKHDIDIKNS